MLRVRSKALLSLSLCCVFACGGFRPAAARPSRDPADSVWIYPMSFQTHETVYFDLGHDGSFFAVRAGRYAAGFSEVLAGRLTPAQTEHVFSVVTSESAGTDIFVGYGGRIYQVDLRTRAAPRIVR